MNDRIEYNNGSFDVYTNDSGWLDFLSSLSYFRFLLNPVLISV